MNQNIQHKITSSDDVHGGDGWICTCGATGMPDTSETRDAHLRAIDGSKVKKLIYLASPHSHPDANIRQERYKETLKCQNWLVSNGFWVFSPIVFSHYTTETLQYLDFSFWKEFDTEMITRMDELWVLDIEGTLSSVGVKAEIEIAVRQGKRVMIIKPFYPDYQAIEWSPEAIHLGVKLSLKEDAQTS